MYGADIGQIPESEFDIRNNAFRDCTGLTTINFPNSLNKIGDTAFYGCSGLTSVVIPNSVSKIGHSAFYGCTNLRNLTIDSDESSVTLGSNVFKYCPLENLTLGRNIVYESVSYSQTPFYNNKSLGNVTITDMFQFCKWAFQRLLWTDLDRDSQFRCKHR